MNFLCVISFKICTTIPGSIPLDAGKHVKSPPEVLRHSTNKINAHSFIHTVGTSGLFHASSLQIIKSMP